MSIPKNVCRVYAQVLGGKAKIVNGVCTVYLTRNDIYARVLNRRTHSPLVINNQFSFESIDKNGRALNLGEVVVLKNEIIPLVNVLLKKGLRIKLHNYWGLTNPKLTKVQFESIENPILFAIKAKAALNTISK